jgi:hypothetical protein
MRLTSKQTWSACAVLMLLGLVASLITTPTSESQAWPWGHRQAAEESAINNLPQGAIGDLRTLFGDSKEAARDVRIYLHAGKVAAKAFVQDIDQQEARAMQADNAGTIKIPIIADIKACSPSGACLRNPPAADTDTPPAEIKKQSSAPGGCASGQCGVSGGTKKLFRRWR